MRVLIYARVSTPEQNLETQLSSLRRYAEVQGWQIGGEYTDVASGADSQRRGLEAMLEAAQPGDIIIASKIDRIARSVTHLQTVLYRLQVKGVRFIAVDQGIDTDRSNPVSQLLLHVISAIAEFERELIRERVKAGIQRFIRQGGRLGRPRRLVDKLKLRELRDQGLSLREAAKRLGISPATAYRRLREC